MSGPNPAMRNPLYKIVEADGFTLLELVLTMFIIALTVGIVIPRMPDFAGMQIQRSTRKAGMMVQLARNRAVTLRRYYRVDVDIDEAVLRASYLGPEELYIADEMVKSVNFPDEITIVDLLTSGEGKVVKGSGGIHISPRGIIEPAIIHLEDEKGRVRSVVPHMVSGEVLVKEGYEEFSIE